jgi:hypothetical protein
MSVPPAFWAEKVAAVIMLQFMILLSVLVWLPLLLFQFVNRSYIVLLCWLLIAPIATYFANNIHSSPIYQKEVNLDPSKAPKIKSKGEQLYADANVRLNELLEPNRLVFALLFAVLFIEMLLLKRHRIPLDWTEIWMGLFVVILLASVLFQARRVMFGLRVVTDAFMVPFMGYYIARRLVRRQEDQAACSSGSARSHSECA